MSVLRVWMAQKTESGPSTNAHLHGEQELKSWRFFWLFELIEGFWWKFHCMHLASETRLSSVSLMGLEMYAPSPTSTYSSDPTHSDMFQKSCIHESY